MARRQGGKGLLGRGGHVAHLGGIAQNGGSHGFAQGGVETLVDTLGIGGCKAHQASVHAASQHAARFDIVERGRLRHACHQNHGGCKGTEGFYHGVSF